MNTPRIVLVGFMGSGKTTVAKALARKLKCQFIDLDSFLSESEGRSPAEIISQDGETAFRKIETKILKTALKEEWGVMALGGGTWTIETNRRLMNRGQCISVWLDASFDLCWKRITAKGKSSRPLAPNRKRTQVLYQSRLNDYRRAQLHIKASGKSASTLATEIKSYLS